MPGRAVMAAVLAVAAMPAVAPADRLPAPLAASATDSPGPCPQLRLAQGGRVVSQRGPKSVRVSLPAGLYRLRIGSGLECPEAKVLATSWMRRGVMPNGGWAFTLPGNRTRRFTWLVESFDLTLLEEPDPTAGREGALCQGRVYLERADRAGPVRMPKGDYSIALLDRDIEATGLDCKAAAGFLARFLRGSALPGAWSASSSRNSFYRGRETVGFTVHRTARARSGCPRVKVSRRVSVSKVSVPAGSYALSSSWWGCDQLVDTFRQFVDRERVPGAWNVKLLRGSQVRRFTYPEAGFHFDAKLASRD